MSGNVIEWQRWHLHAHIDPVEGLVISDVSYTDGGRRRSILHRASIGEMVVPYGDTSEDFYFRNVFDAGEYNLGKTVGSLSLGCDCLGEIRYLDAVLADEGGAPVHRHQRHLPARGGLRHPLEALGLPLRRAGRGQALPPDGRVGHPHDR